MKPRVILLTGAPGTGKSTLGTAVASALRVPFIARDAVRGGLLFSEGAWGSELTRVPTSDEAVAVFLETVEGLLGRGVSCVAEYVVRAHRPVDLERLRAAGDCVVVITSCRDATSRLVDRNQGDRLIARPTVLRAAGVNTVEEHTEAMLGRMQRVERDMARAFPVPTLHVDTTNGYDPTLDAILAFVTTYT